MSFFLFFFLLCFVLLLDSFYTSFLSVVLFPTWVSSTERHLATLHSSISQCVKIMLVRDPEFVDVFPLRSSFQLSHSLSLYPFLSHTALSLYIG